MICEINTQSSNNTSNQDLFYAFSDTIDRDTLITPNLTKIKTTFEWIALPIFTDNLPDFLTRSIRSEAFESMLASEKSLAKYWDTPEEDEAWAHL